jgi:hypothetical protein
MKAIAGKRYRHYRNGKEYTVIATGRLESEPTEECVIYRAEYDSPEFGYGAVWVRSRTNFEEMVDLDGAPVPRFTETTSV